MPQLMYVQYMNNYNLSEGSGEKKTYETVLLINAYMYFFEACTL